MREHGVTRPREGDTSKPADKGSALLHRRTADKAVIDATGEVVSDSDPAAISEPRFGYDLSLVPALTGMVSQPMVQRSPKDASASGESILPALLVDDSATEIAPGQMKKSEFLVQLQDEVCRTVGAAIAGTGRTTDECPYLNYWFDFYSGKDSAYIERVIHRYAPGAAGITTAGGYISVITQRARQSAETWARTGRITGVPEGVPVTLPGETTAPGGESVDAGTGQGQVMFKAREGGVRSAPQSIQKELGEGRPLDSGVRSRMETAFSTDFSNVRAHTDTTAAGLSTGMNARAFTVGKHVAFGSGEYKPGTLTGDALIAHELAHVVQQGGAIDSIAPMQVGDTGYNALEEEADKSAVGAVVSLWGNARDSMKDFAANIMPNLRSGLRLQRCKRDDKTNDNERVEEEVETLEEELPEKSEAPEEVETSVETEEERNKREVAAVKSVYVEGIEGVVGAEDEVGLEGNVKGAESHLQKAIDRRKKALDEALDEAFPFKGQEWADKKIAALEADQAKNLDEILEAPDSGSVIVGLRNDIIEANENLTGKKEALTAGKEKWHKYDDYFSSQEVVDNLKEKEFKPAELKALVAQESYDLTVSETVGDIAGIAQMSKEVVEEVGKDPEDRLVDEKAIPIAALVLIKKSEQLEGELNSRGLAIPTGVEYKKFVYASYNTGARTIAVSADKAKEMKRDETLWANLVEGDKESPLYLGIDEVFEKQDWPKEKRDKKYYEVIDYVTRILFRLQ